MCIGGIYICFLFLIYCTADHVTSRNVTISVFAPKLPNSRLFSLSKIQPAVEIGREEVIRREILPSIDLELYFTNSNLSAVDAPISAFELNSAGHNVFLGPVYDYALAPVARYAPKWNMPVVTVGGLSHSFRYNRKAEYSTLTRAGASFDKTAEFLGVILEEFKWRKFMLLYESLGMRELFNNYGFLAGESIINWELGSDDIISDARRLELLGPNPEEEFLLHEISNGYASKFLKICLCIRTEL